VVLVKKKKNRNHPRSGRAGERARDRAAFALYCAALVLSPLLFGSVHTYAYTLVFSGILTATVLVLFDQVRKDRETGVPAFLCMKTSMNFLFLAVLVYLFLQILPLPASWVGLLSPEAGIAGSASVPPAREISPPGAGGSGWQTLAPYVYPVRMSIVRWIVYGFLFFGLCRTLKTRKRIETAVACILVTAVFDSVYGIMEAYGATHRIWWYAMPGGRAAVSGTYVNPNHFAGLMGMGLTLAVTYAAALSAPPAAARSGEREKNPSFRARMAELLSGERRISKRSLAAFSGGVIGLGLLGSGSRGGLVSAAVGFAVMTGLFLCRGGQSRNRKGGLLIALILLSALSYGLYRGLDLTFERFRSQGYASEGRSIYIRNSLTLFSDYPAFGIGPGNFQYAYPRYRTPEEEGQFLTDAHSDWVQVLAETGVAGVVIVLAGLLVYLGRSFRKWRERRDPFAVWLGVLPFAAAGNMAAHSLFEFNLHVPANFLVFTALLAIGTRASALQIRPGGEQSGLRFARLPLRVRGGLLFLLLLGLALWSEVWLLRHFFAEWNCNTVLNSTLHHDPSPPVEEIRRAIRWDGGNAAYRYKLAVKERFLRDTPQGREELEAAGIDPGALSGEIVAALEAACALNPFSPEYHLLLGWEYSFLWNRPEYEETWLQAADLAMTRATLFGGATHPWLHKEMGNYWLMRSKSFWLSQDRRDEAFERAGGQYRVALSLQDPAGKARMQEEIRTYAWNLYPDESFRRRLLGE
jgi:O-antigen ligase